MKEWIIPVVIAIVWILNAVLRNRENDEPVRAPRGKAGDGRPNRAPASDIDRFLQEIEAMKKRSAPAQAPAPAPARATAPKPRPATRPSSPGSRPATPRVRIVAAEAVVPAPVVVAPEPTPVRPPRPPAVMPPATVTPGRRPVAAALQLLRSPNAAVNAVILSEILGPPKSKRR